MTESLYKVTNSSNTYYFVADEKGRVVYSLPNNIFKRGDVVPWFARSLERNKFFFWKCQKLTSYKAILKALL